MNYEKAWNNLKKALWIYWVEVETNYIRSDEMADLIMYVMTCMEKKSIQDDPENIASIFFNVGDEEKA